MKIGFGQMNITPPIPTLMAGSVTIRVAEKVHDDLFAKTMVLDDGERKIAIVGCDVIALKRRTVAKAREIIQNNSGIDKVIISATHNHAGPLTTEIFSQAPDEIYLEVLAHKIAMAVAVANQNLTEGEIGIGTGKAEEATFNRRFIMTDGEVQTQPSPGDKRIVKPEGPKDSEVGVIYAEKQGTLLGGVVNFSSHALCVGWIPEKDYVISADYPGYIAHTIRKTKGEKSITVFLNGACGNLNPVDYLSPSLQKESHQLAEERGKRIGREALRIMEEMSLSSQHSIRAASKIISLPLRDISKKELKEARQLGEEITEDLQKEEFTSGFMDNHMELTLTSLRGKKLFAQEILELYKERKGNPYINAEVQVIRIGNGAIVGIPAELFTEFGLEIKKRSPFTYTFVAELSNGCVGYVPTEEAFLKGGNLSYETHTARSSKLAPEAGKMFVETAIELLKKLSG